MYPHDNMSNMNERRIKKLSYVTPMGVTSMGKKINRIIVYIFLVFHAVLKKMLNLSKCFAHKL